MPEKPSKSRCLVASRTLKRSPTASSFKAGEDFRWAMAHVWSRCLRLEIKGKQRRLLVPLLARRPNIYHIT